MTLLQKINEQIWLLRDNIFWNGDNNSKFTIDSSRLSWFKIESELNLTCGNLAQRPSQFLCNWWCHLECVVNIFLNNYILSLFLQVIDSSLNDIKLALYPSFTANDIAILDKNTTLSRDQYGVAYLPGFVGLNNLSSTDYLNVTLHALAHISPLRNFFLVPSNYENTKSPLVRISRIRFDTIL